MSTTDVFRDALALPLKERADLASQLLRSLDEEETEDSGAEEAWAAEIERRVREYRAGTAKSYSLEEVMADAFKSIGKSCE